MRSRVHRGYFTAGPHVERDTLTCGHCQLIILVKPGNGVSTAVPFCRGCMTYVCEVCSGKAECRPWEKQLEAIESRGRFFKSLGIE